MCIPLPARTLPGGIQISEIKIKVPEVGTHRRADAQGNLPEPAQMFPALGWQNAGPNVAAQISHSGGTGTGK